METQNTEEKKVWIKPELVVYGEIEKLTAEIGANPPLGSNFP
jgi:hypothetical protein